MNQKIIIIVAVPLLAIGVLGGLAFTGKIHVPGITPAASTKKKADSKPADSTDPSATDANNQSVKSSNASSKLDSPSTPQVPSSSNSSSASESVHQGSSSNSNSVPGNQKTAIASKLPLSLNLQAGATKIAAIWSEMDASEVVKLTAGYTTDELARIFSQMDDSQVAQVLSQMPVKQATAISKTIEKQASIVQSTGVSS